MWKVTVCFFPKRFLLCPFHSDYLKFPFPSSSLTSKETLKVYTSLSGVGRTKSFTWSDACLEERLNAVEKLYKIRLTCRKAKSLIFWSEIKVFLMRHCDVSEGQKITCLLYWTQIMPHVPQSTQHHMFNITKPFQYQHLLFPFLIHSLLMSCSVS